MTELRPGVIFDLDGTLVDSNYLHTLAWARALRARGVWMPMNAIHRLIGMGTDQLLPRLIGCEDPDIATRRESEYAQLVDDAVAFPSGACYRVMQRGLPRRRGRSGS